MRVFFLTCDVSTGVIQSQKVFFFFFLSVYVVVTQEKPINGVGGEYSTEREWGGKPEEEKNGQVCSLLVSFRTHYKKIYIYI